MVIGSFRTPYITHRLVGSVQPNSLERHFPRVDFTIDGTLAHTLEYGIEIESFPVSYTHLERTKDLLNTAAQAAHDVMAGGAFELFAPQELGTEAYKYLCLLYTSRCV